MLFEYPNDPSMEVHERVVAPVAITAPAASLKKRDRRELFQKKHPHHDKKDEKKKEKEMTFEGYIGFLYDTAI